MATPSNTPRQPSYVENDSLIWIDVPAFILAITATASKLFQPGVLWLNSPKKPDAESWVLLKCDPSDVRFHSPECDCLPTYCTDSYISLRSNQKRSQMMRLFGLRSLTTCVFGTYEDSWYAAYLVILWLLLYIPSGGSDMGGLRQYMW